MHIDLDSILKDASSSVQGALVFVGGMFSGGKGDLSVQVSVPSKTICHGPLQLDGGFWSAFTNNFNSPLNQNLNIKQQNLADGGPGPLNFLRIAFSLDSLNPSPLSAAAEECQCKSRNVGQDSFFALFSNKDQNRHSCSCRAGRDRKTSGQHFLGFLVQVPGTGPQHEASHVEKSPGGTLFLQVFLREVLSFTKSLGSRKATHSYARVQGEPHIMEPEPCEDDGAGQPVDAPSLEIQRALVMKSGIPRFNVKLPKIEELRSSPLAASLAEVMELVPQLGKTSQEYPDKRKLFSVQDFFEYTEAEGRKLFDELDRDKDGQVNLEDLELAMKKRRLPQSYARKFLQRSRKHWLKKSFGWHEFLSLMEQKEPMMLRAFNSLSVSKSGTLQKGQVLSLLRNAGLPATQENAAAMMRFLDSDTKGSITYGQFRNFLVLLPPERLYDDPRMVWFEAATVVPMAPPVEMATGSVLKSALAGGLACALSTSFLHPLDTLKTRVQASTVSFSELLSNVPNIGVRGLYRGSAPAIIGQFSSHGLRTGIFEASKLLMFNVAPNVPELQVQSVASFCSTFLGTALRIPCEVLKQRLQAGLYENVGEAISGTLQKDGWKGFFRGTGATLCREVPFYVAGMLFYEEAKKAVQNLLKRDLAAWEFIAIGGLSGGLAAVCTTPFDVMKTRMMTATPGASVTMSSVAFKIVNEEGVLALFKGAVPRFFWIAPLGAMNFAGYELAKRAMEKEKRQGPG